MEEIDPGLFKEFQNKYRLIQKLLKEWEESQNSSFPLIESIVNLSEQLECCNEGAFMVELRNEFPDLKQRLAYKILKAMEGKMKKLYDLLYTFENINEKLESVKNSTFQVYHECAEKVDVEMLTRGSPTCPPLSILLEWMVDLNRWYNSLYEQKKDLLDNISYDDKTYLQSLQRKWKDETCLYRVKGIMEQVRVFLSSFPA